MHFYAGTHGQYLRDKAQTALDNGIALMVTEWGTVNADGNGAVNETSVIEWMDFLCDNSISHCNWAMNDKYEGASALLPGSSSTGNWTVDDLSVSGLVVKDIVENWNSSCNYLGVTEEYDNGMFDFELYPNPTNGIITISGENIHEVKIWNINNQLLRSITINKKQFNIDLGNLPKGIYFLSVTTNNGVFVKKIVLK